MHLPIALMFGMPGGWEILLILVVLLLLFGGKKLPELARGLGKSINEFRRGRDELAREIRNMEQDLDPRRTGNVEEKEQKT